MTRNNMLPIFKGIFTDSKDRLLFIIGCIATFYVNIIGRVYLGELVIFILYLVKPEIRKTLPKTIRTVMSLLILWLISALITDLWCETPAIDMLKGTVSILFIILLLPFVYWALSDKLTRWFPFYLGTIISSQLTYYLVFSQTEFGSSDIWRTYSYVPLFIGAAMLAYWNGKQILSCIILALFGFWILYAGSRNSFLTCSFTVIIIFAVRSISKYPTLKRLVVYRNKIATMLITMILVFFVVDHIYETLASNGSLGREAYLKYELQKNNDLGLASGRIEFIIDLDLIRKSPIIGYGSFAKDRDHLVDKFYKEYDLKRERTDNNKKEIDSVQNMLPRHSILGGMWMWHGIGAGIFWLYFLYVIFRTFRTGSFLLEPKLIALSVYFMMAELWDIFFSPLATRLPIIFLLVYLVLIYDKYKLQWKKIR